MHTSRGMVARGEMSSIICQACVFGVKRSQVDETDHNERRCSMAQAGVGVLHPGEMGASVGAAARRGGMDVMWASAGRSAATQTRASADGLRDVGTLQNVVKMSDIIVSVCPPGAALAVAQAVAS